MPRRDGLPTNEEMLVDFTNSARDLYIEAFERRTADGLPPAWEGKPLSALHMVFERVPYARIPESDMVGDERLVVRPVHEYDVIFEDNKRLRKLPEDVQANYFKTAEWMGGLIIDSGLVVRSDIPTAGIHADWQLRYRTGRSRHVSSYKELPQKASIASGQYFVEQAQEYVRSGEFDLPFSIKILGHIYDKLNDKTGVDDDNRIMRHSISFDYVADLPLNGHESTSFLEGYAQYMFARAMGVGRRIERLKELMAPNELVMDDMQSSYDMYLASYQRAQAILDVRGR